MASISFYKRHNEIRHKAGLAWDWLRKRPEYKRDYDKWNKIKNSISSVAKEELKKKYGFYPLINPGVNNKHFYIPLSKKEKLPKTNRRRLQPPLQFFIGFNNFWFKEKAFESGVDYITLDYIDLNIYRNPKRYKKYVHKTKLLPDKLRIEIDPKKPIDFILSQIKNYLRIVKETYHIKDERFSTTDLDLVYINYVLENLKIPKRKIREMISPYSDTEIVNESRRKKAYRISKKLESIWTRK
jgi:hypothetical protein